MGSQLPYFGHERKGVRGIASNASRDILYPLPFVGGSADLESIEQERDTMRSRAMKLYHEPTLRLVEEIGAKEIL